MVAADLDLELSLAFAIACYVLRDRKPQNPKKMNGALGGADFHTTPQNMFGLVNVRAQGSAAADTQSPLLRIP